MSSSTTDENPLTHDSPGAAIADATNGGDDVVQLRAGFDSDGMPFARAVLTPDSDRRRKEILVDPRPPIPVIFIPGVMGTLLADRDTGEEIWSPPNLDKITSAIPGIVSVLGGYFDSAAKRATRFNPASAVVDPRGPVKVSHGSLNSGLSEEEARRRGWSTVHRWSYQPTLVWLVHTLNRPMLGGVPQGEWVQGDPEGQHAALKAVLGTHPGDYGGHGPGEAITAESDVFRALCRYRYPVYAIGYNFLQSNLISGQQVLDGVDFEDPGTKKITRIMGIREICRENDSEKAIIITHSMGGLVARMASQLCGGAGSMYGVVHGAQPATGAPLFAKRFRTGGEGNTFRERLVNKSLLGRDDAEFVAVVSNAEGPMELSPMPDYNDGKPWWIFADMAGNERMALPKQSALDEFYINDAWYGLLPDPSLLDPAGIVKKCLEETGKHISVYENLKLAMRAVVNRQDMLRNNYHPNTYAMYGDGALKSSAADSTQATPSKLEFGKAEEQLKTWGRVVWQGDLPEGVTEADLKGAELLHDDHHGVLILVVRGQTVRFTVQQQAVASKDGEKDNGIIDGDGTVPVWSAAAQGRGLIDQSVDKANGVQMVFVQGGYDHQFCFDHPWTRWATLYSVARIAQSIGVPVT